jgi:hypothetical protein
MHNAAEQVLIWGRPQSTVRGGREMRSKTAPLGLAGVLLITIMAGAIHAALPPGFVEFASNYEYINKLEISHYGGSPFIRTTLGIGQRILWPCGFRTKKYLARCEHRYKMGNTKYRDTWTVIKTLPTGRTMYLDKRYGRGHTDYWTGARWQKVHGSDWWPR